ncbi:tyrosine-type recombinase/integrase [Burkholderia gladioli]|uniref:tyrosine-type recombinase/integrase n=1 Tax=Burkholderia gladioli TaxID=28095 RepID=UPI001FC8577E|nr:tyrosine-type recombinase/integrase [Burkholderia gladioli]
MERWIGWGRVERFDPAWRPFAGPLSDRRDTARRILTAMGAWLVRQQYLRVNPFDGLAAAELVPIDTAGRTLTHAQWRYVLQSVWQAEPAIGTERNRSAAARGAQRDAFVLLLAYATGLRRAELAAATTGDLTREALDGAFEDAYVLRVNGKGRRRREVPMPTRLMEMLRAQLRERARSRARRCTRTRSARSSRGSSRARPSDSYRASRALRRNWSGRARTGCATRSRTMGSTLAPTSVTFNRCSATTTHYPKGDASRQYQTVDAFFNAALDGAGVGPSAAAIGQREQGIDDRRPDLPPTRAMRAEFTLRIRPKRRGRRDVKPCLSASSASCSPGICARRRATSRTS